MMSWNGEPAGYVWTDHSEIPLRGGEHPKATTFPGGPWEMRSPKTAAAHKVAVLVDWSPEDIEERRAP